MKKGLRGQRRWTIRMYEKQEQEWNKKQEQEFNKGRYAQSMQSSAGFTLG